MSELVTAPAPVPANAPANAPANTNTPLDEAVDGVAAPAARLQAKPLTDGALHFLATASNEALGGCLVGLGAATYLVLGRLGLVLMGVVGGVVLHATWDGQQLRSGEDADKSTSSDARKRELGAHVAARLLDWRDQKHSRQRDPTVNLDSANTLDYSSLQPDTAAALTELTDAIIRDYVKYVLGLLHTTPNPL